MAVPGWQSPDNAVHEYLAPWAVAHRHSRNTSPRAIREPLVIHLDGKLQALRTIFGHGSFCTPYSKLRGSPHVICLANTYSVTNRIDRASQTMPLPATIRKYAGSNTSYRLRSLFCSDTRHLKGENTYRLRSRFWRRQTWMSYAGSTAYVTNRQNHWRCEGSDDFPFQSRTCHSWLGSDANCGTGLYGRNQFSSRKFLPTTNQTK